MDTWAGVYNGRAIPGAVPIPSNVLPYRSGAVSPCSQFPSPSFTPPPPPTSDLSACALYSVDMVTLATALEIFNEHDLQPSDRAMDVVEVIHCLTSLYERLEEERGILVNVPLCVDMSLNWLLNVFDRYHPQGIPPQLGLLCLGAAKWPQLVRMASTGRDGAGWSGWGWWVGMGLAGVGLSC